MVNNLFSPELEQSILAVLLQFPETYSEISWLNNKDFSKVNGPIFSVIQQIIESKGRPDTVIVAERLKSIGITLDGIDVGTYCETLTSLRSVEPKNIVELAKELKKKTLVRRVVENCDSLKRDVIANQDDSGTEIINKVDRYLGDSLIGLAPQDNTGTNMLEVLPDMIEEMGNEPDKVPYVRPPYDTLYNAHGGWKPGTLTFFVARRAMGKSLLKLDICRKVSKDQNTKILYMDSELSLRDQILRFVCGSIGAPYHLIDNHQWRKDAEWCPKIRAELDRIRNDKNKNIWFEHIGNMGGPQMVSFAKNWWLKNVGRGDSSNGASPCLIIYDYFKMTNADSKNNAEYMEAYAKTEMLKDLAEYCSCPIISSIQANREGVAGRDGPEDSALSVSVSDRLGWLASYMGIWRKRTHEELMEDSTPTEIAPSHKLIDIKKRYFGVGGDEFDKPLRIKVGKSFKYIQNYINFDVQGFNVVDKLDQGSLLRRQGRLASKLPISQEASPI